MTAEQQAALLKYAKVAKAQLAIGRISREGPQQPMQISRSFYLGVYEVIREQSQRVIGVNPTRPIGRKQPEGEGQRIAEKCHLIIRFTGLRFNDRFWNGR